MEERRGFIYMNLFICRAQHLYWGGSWQYPLCIFNPSGGTEGGIHRALICVSQEGRVTMTPTSSLRVIPYILRVQGTGRRLDWWEGVCPVALCLGPNADPTSFPSCQISSCFHCHLQGPCHLSFQRRWPRWQCCLGCIHSVYSQAHAAG